HALPISVWQPPPQAPSVSAVPPTPYVLSPAPSVSTKLSLDRGPVLALINALYIPTWSFDIEQFDLLGRRERTMCWMEVGMKEGKDKELVATGLQRAQQEAVLMGRLWP